MSHEHDASKRLDSRTFGMTGREREILELVCEGRSNGNIAAREGVGVETVKTHVRALFFKFGVQGRPELIAKALHTGVIKLRPDAFDRKYTSAG